MSAFQIFTQPSQQALDTAANVLSGATLTFSLTGTSTPTNAYSDSALTIPLANPLSANAAGVFVPVFLSPTIVYRVVLKTQAGVVLQTWDPANEQLLSQALIGYYLYPRTDAEIFAGVTPVNYAYPPFDVRRYGGGPGFSTTLNDGAIQAVMLLGGPIYFCAGVWDYTVQPWFQTDNVHVYGDGIDVTILRPQGWIDGLRFADSSYPGVTTVLTGVTVADLTIDGTNQTAGGGTDTAGNGLNINGCDFVSVHRVKCVNVLYQNIVSTYFSSGDPQRSLVIANCQVDGVNPNRVGIGVEGNHSDCLLANNIITGNEALGIFVSTGTSGSADTGKTLVTGNKVVGPTGTGTYGIAIFDGAYRTEVVGNHISGADISIRMADFDGDASITDILVATNYCLQWTTGGIMLFPMHSTDSTEGLVVGNLCKSSVASGSSTGIVAGKNSAIVGNKIFSGATGIGCSGNGQQLLSNSIVGPATSVDCSSSTGVIAQGNYYNGAISLSSDTIWDHGKGYGGSVASATSITLPLFGDVFTVTGTTNIDNISPTNNQGRTVKLIFAGVLSVGDGNNLKLSAAFATSADDTLTLTCNGSNWFECSRSAN